MKKFLTIISIILLIITLIALYSRFIETSKLVTKELSINENIPESYDGLKIVHFSDLHYGRVITKNYINNLIKEINLINPDLVIFTGDLIDKDTKLKESDIAYLTDSLKSINAKLGKYSIMGNHDYTFKEKIKNIYSNSDFILLINSNDIIYNTNNDPIFIGGLDSTLEGTPDIAKTINNIEVNYKIMLTHEPDISDQIIKQASPNLILSGHSHNGQIRLPLIGAIIKPNGAEKYYDNHYQVNNTNIYISSGIGESRINFRLFNSPSINFYRINKTN